MANITVCNQAVEHAAHEFQVPADMIYMMFSDQPIMEKLNLAAKLDYWSRHLTEKFDFKISSGNTSRIYAWLIIETVNNIQTREEVREIAKPIEKYYGSGVFIAFGQYYINQIIRADTIEQAIKWFHDGYNATFMTSLRKKVIIEFQKKANNLIKTKLEIIGDNPEEMDKFYNYYYEQFQYTNTIDMTIYNTICEKWDESSLNLLENTSSIKQADEAFRKSRKEVNLLIAYVKKLDEIMSKQ